ncbi:MAG: ABC transporter permease [Bacteroidales bacterium]|nr:ABC transporter permease [Bacteroidales bacterium]
MNLRTIGLVIRREYLNKVKKKSFLVTTLLVPILVGGGMVAMMFVLLNTKDKLKTIGVVDRSEIVLPMLENTETLDFVDFSAQSLDSVKANISNYGLDAVLSISAIDSVAKSVTADITSPKPLGIEPIEVIESRINKAVEQYRIESYGIADLEQIMKDVKSNISIKAYTVDEQGKETISETGVYAIISMILGIIIFMFVALYGSMVMSAVIEEKSSRVIEVLVSSVKTTDLMFGKIIGIALVAITQFLLWIVLTGIIVSVAGTAFGKSIIGDGNPAEMVENISGMDASQLESMASVEAPSEISVVLTTLKNMDIGGMIVAFLVFFVFGYMLYASLYAAIGSAADNEGDTQQLTMPVTIPLMVAYFIALYTFRAPDSSIALWGSMIPFTSPIVMIARLPFGVPAWEMTVSIVLLVVTTAVCAWLSAKIYRVGILMFGKKSTWKDLWTWLKQK